MHIEVTIISTQIMKKTIDTQKQQYKGNLTEYQKGVLIEFGDNENNYQMMILKNKIITKKQNQKMIFDLSQKTNSMVITPYGKLSMRIKTEKIEINKQNQKIDTIYLVYQIILEEKEEYQNRLEIKIQY